MINRFVADAQRISVGRIVDQIFLRTKIWPIVRQSVLQHDSLFRFAGADDFPCFGHRGHGLYVGQGDRAMQEMLGFRPQGRTLLPDQVGL
jgi:hypothetical protein